MTFPNGPFGQGFPDQPGYQQPTYTQQPGFPPMLGQPQQPGFPQQPGYPGGQPPNALASGEPSGATGMIAATLAGLGGVLGVGAGAVAVFGLVAIGSLRHASGGTYALMVVSMLLSIIFGLTLLVGAVLLFQRKMIGRWLVVGGCAVAILGGLVSFGFGAALESDYSSFTDGTNPLSLVSLIFPIATLVLALLPSTGAWIEAKQKPVAPQPYPPYPGW